MDKSWKDRASKDPEYAFKRSHAKDAYHSECWVYSELTRRVYSPEEFMESDEPININRGRPDDRKFKIIKPDVILQHKLQQLNKLMQEITEIQSKMKDYYNLNRKK